MSLLDALRRIFGGSYQPSHPPRPDLTPEEQAEPRGRRLAVDESTATDRGDAAQDDGPSSAKRPL
jgi:hypothetical protein